MTFNLVSSAQRADFNYMVVGVLFWFLLQLHHWLQPTNHWKVQVRRGVKKGPRARREYPCAISSSWPLR